MLIMLIINIISAKTLQCTVTVTDMYSRKTLCKKTVILTARGGRVGVNLEGEAGWSTAPFTDEFQHILQLTTVRCLQQNNTIIQ